VRGVGGLQPVYAYVSHVRVVIAIGERIAAAPGAR
jgi:hypothetical protein